ncbi:hypothetical protein QTG54_002405 [Skeletonema marinoi]|uniref:Uncharacterized protein n=1 Tax=Skeletonema marinoi TaxID=267567 RepID=A0AAD8YL24_9STRA|nr:hypothetical protein QTG54_002405 [Skeletonema marinoi]|mmetsp:Transcript_25568/g.43330  ORF Transcript_25568/g.43330 Transcript_25568/m.43330 type:complete len:107 (+) Transcript_25568:220-540(+)|eukprot:CAMPEP_0113411872 /NCGR_PEP_ID=MMETSP0013_2-20120614/22521_1 /TAXON_ID=2843 ORGANISM="Skeletonema costatum, Strain 1716" /NCGR_SAMPLE_ID=MMETSP0013_2 /ASSEMBLY_ACC=CAM_ASM_000158 /LENGTH=106 /DNA_ID=CAMNT_0000298303 /DNA_START=169 /DNA_END=489 /DNA_ORIENTATION=- /assembly_acc=CAM_ASM_000158
MCSDIGTTSRVCAMYSFTGIIFTLYVGVLLQTQPFFITGIDDISTAKSNAFGAMGMFIATFGISLFGIMRTSDDKSDDLEGEGFQLGTVTSVSSRSAGDYAASRYD